MKLAKMNPSTRDAFLCYKTLCILTTCISPTVTLRISVIPKLDVKLLNGIFIDLFVFILHLPANTKVYNCVLEK